MNRRTLGRRALAAAAGLLTVLLASSVAAQAAGPPQQGAGDAASQPSLFISPAGEPFRAGAGEPYPVVRWFARVDANHDGRIDRMEFRADAEAFFKALDKNHDGIVDAFEVADYEHDVAPEIMGAYRPPTGPSGGARHGHGRGPESLDEQAGAAAVTGGAAPYDFLGDPEPVEAADSNLDGRITLADFLAEADRRFDRLDPKGLGYLTLANLPKTPFQKALEQKSRR